MTSDWLRFSLRFALFMLVIDQENFTSDQKSLMALFHEVCCFYACSNEFWQVALFFRLACRAVWKLIFAYTWREKCSAVQSPLLMTGWLSEFSLSKEGSTVGCILAKKWASIIVPVNWDNFWILSKKHSCAIMPWVARQRRYPFSGPHMDATNYRTAGS